MKNIIPSLPMDWARALRDKWPRRQIEQALQERIDDGEQIFPSRDNIFAAFRETPLDAVRAVWLGQDPYHDDGQATGLAFAVPDNVPAPPSLRNILQEYANDLQCPVPACHSLLPWAHHGVLLLNSVLTVRAHSAASHRGIGWEEFVAAVLSTLAARTEPTAFLLLGNDANKFLPIVKGPHNIIFQAPHPSPLSAYRGFFGSRPFSTINRLLAEQGCKPINWKL